MSSMSLNSLSVQIGRTQRTPFSGVGPPVFCARSRLGFGRAPASTEKNRYDSFDCGMETTTLHATVEGIIMVLLR